MSRRPAPTAAARGAAPSRPGRQRIVAIMAFTLIGVSSIAVVALLVLRGTGTPDSAFRSGGLAILALLPLPGLTIGLVLVVGLIVLNAMALARSSRR